MAYKSCVICYWQKEEIDYSVVGTQNILDGLKTCKKHASELKNEIEKEKQMPTEFPKSDSKFLKTDMFQDQEVPLTYLSWDRKSNDDRTFNGKTVGWRDTLKYCLAYTYPQMAINKETGEQRLNKEGKPFQNKYWNPDFPQGYTIIYSFEEGKLETGSLPLWEAFCLANPKPGETVVIGKTGLQKETKWKVKRITKDGLQAKINTAHQEELPEIQLEEQNSGEIPF